MDEKQKQEHKYKTGSQDKRTQRTMNCTGKSRETGYRYRQTGNRHRDDEAEDHNRTKAKQDSRKTKDKENDSRHTKTGMMKRIISRHTQATRVDNSVDARETNEHTETRQHA